MAFKCQPSRFEDLNGWQDDDYRAAFAAFVISARHHVYVKHYPEHEISISQPQFLNICKQALHLNKRHNVTNDMAKLFFETHFLPHLIIDTQKSGFVTAYYEPEIRASFIKNDKFRYPIYRQPEDLKSIKHLASSRADELENFDFAKQTENGYEIYADRKTIDNGYLKGKDLEIAYAASRADVYFTHIQGSAKLIDDHGQTTRISYAAKTGHPYTSIGKILVERGIIAQEDISMETIRNWMDKTMDINRHQVDEILWHNQSYIFFSENNQLEDQLGPVGAARVQLMSEHSLAVDRKIHQFGLPIFVSTKTDILENGSTFNKLMIAQDTGSAIVGASRGDIFIGSGVRAGQIAGKVRSEAEFYILLPKI